MHHYRLKASALTFFSLLLQPIPTPTPVMGQSQVLQQASNTLADGQKLLETASSVTALGILALVVIAIILYIVFGRNRGREYQTLINEQAKQNAASYAMFEGVIKDLRQDLADSHDAERQARDEYKIEIQKLQDDYRLENFKRDERVIETFNAVMEGLSKNTERSQKNENGIAALTETVTEGSPIVRAIGKKVDDILRTTGEILSAQQATIPAEELARLTTELRLAVSALNNAVEKLNKRSTQPLPEAVAEPVEKPA